MFYLLVIYTPDRRNRDKFTYNNKMEKKSKAYVNYCLSDQCVERMSNKVVLYLVWFITNLPYS